MSDAIFGYLAGILDGEGSVMIRRSTYRMTNTKYGDCKNPSYVPRVQIKMTDQRPLKLFKETFGGSLTESKMYHSISGYKSNYKTLFVYAAEHKVAVKILTALLPYMIVKAEQAKLALQIPELKKQHMKRLSDGHFYGQPYSQELITKLSENWLKVKNLNGSRYV